jgi:hypothetical protein
MAVDNFAGNISRGLQGDASPPEGFPPAGDGDFAARMAANAQRAVTFRESLGADLLPTFSAACDRLDGLLDGLGPQDWGKLCYHPLVIIPVRSFVDLRITELVVHEWDIRSRLESNAQVSADSLPAAMNLIPGFVIGRLFQPGPGGVGATRYRFELSGAVPVRHDIVIADGQAHMGPAGTAPADITFECDTETFVLLVYGRISLQSCLDDGRITCQGDRELALSFTQS